MQTEYRKALIDKMSSAVEQAEITINSVKTAYLSAGSGYPVICLHGAGAGAVTWYPSMGALAQHFHVIAPDIVGYGESDKPDAAYDRPFFSSWLKDFMVAMNVSKAHLVGLSQGGAIALQFTIENPEMVEKLVLVDAAGLGAKLALRSLLGIIWTNNLPSYLADRFNARNIIYKGENRDILHRLYSIAVLKNTGGNKAFRLGRGSAASEFPAELLKKINHETLVIWGKNDQLFPVAAGERASQIIPNSRLEIISEAGHLCHMDQPEIFNKLVTDFLNV